MQRLDQTLSELAREVPGATEVFHLENNILFHRIDSAFIDGALEVNHG